MSIKKTIGTIALGGIIACSSNTNTKNEVVHHVIDDKNVYCHVSTEEKDGKIKDRDVFLEIDNGNEHSILLYDTEKNDLIVDKVMKTKKGCEYQRFPSWDNDDYIIPKNYEIPIEYQYLFRYNLKKLK